MNIIDLFSGIGGFSYGLESCGNYNTVAFVECDLFCQRILKAHWPQVPCYSDIREVSGTEGLVDMLCGGFPCQDVSVATGSVAQSLLGDRSGLWFEYMRLINEIKPNWVIIENVEALRNKGLSILLQQLAAAGYDVEWHVIPAYAVGLPHTRKRIWIIAHNMRHRVERGSPFPLSGLRRIPWWTTERGFEDWSRRSNLCPSKLCRSIHGVSYGVDRLRILGNSIVPQIAGAIGMAIEEWELA